MLRSCAVASIREYRPSTDAAALRACFVELQEHERGIDPSLLPGEEIADRYLDRMLSRAAALEGRVFVAEAGGRPCGFVCVWGTVSAEELDADPRPYAYVSDLVVSAPYRRRGVGRQLLVRAEEFARTIGAGRLRINVFAGNADAWRLYRACGFEDYIVQLQRSL